MPELIADIAVNAPLKQLFSYRIPETLAEAAKIGTRVKAPFGRRKVTGFLLQLRQGTCEGLKEIDAVLDEQPLLNPELIRLLRWAADYYCHPIGQVIRNALPGALGSDKTSAKILFEPVYSALPREDLPRGKKQRELLDIIRQQEEVTLSQLRGK